MLREQNLRVHIRFAPSQHAHLIKELFRTFGPAAKSLSVAYDAGGTVLVLGGATMLCRESLTGEDFETLPELENVKSLELHSDFVGGHMRVLSLMPNLQHLHLYGLRSPTIDEDALSIPKRLESIEIRGIFTTKNILGDDFFAKFDCDDTLREVRFHTGIGEGEPITYRQIEPLLKLPKLDRILTPGGGDWINLLPRLRERARAAKQ